MVLFDFGEGDKGDVVVLPKVPRQTAASRAHFGGPKMLRRRVFLAPGAMSFSTRFV